MVRPEYAAATAYGGIIAPPSFVFALDRVLSGYVGGLPGVHAMWSGADLTWQRPMARGDSFRSEAWLADLVEHDTRFAGRAIQQIYEVHLRNQHGETVCAGASWCFRTERDTAASSARSTPSRRPRRRRTTSRCCARSPPRTSRR